MVIEPGLEAIEMSYELWGRSAADLSDLMQENCPFLSEK